MAKRQHLEWELQVGINYWFKNFYPQYLLFSIPNEATAMRANRYRASGMMAGAPDMVLVLKEKVIFIELKAPKGRQSDAQVMFQHKSELLGIEYYVIRDLADLKEILRNNIPLNEWVDL